MSARFEHRAIERQREISHQLAAERLARLAGVVGDRERHRGDDLEAREVLARAPPAALERRQRDVAHVRRIAEPQHDTVSDLAGELQHLAREAGQVDRRRGQPLRDRHAPLHAIVTSLEARAVAERAAEDRHVLAHDAERIVELQAELLLHRRAVAHAEPEQVAPTGLLGQGERCLRRRHGVARIDRQDADAETRARGRGAIRRQHEEGIATGAVRHPDAVVAEGVRATGEIDRGAEIAAGREKGRSLHAAPAINGGSTTRRAGSRGACVRPPRRARWAPCA